MGIIIILSPYSSHALKKEITWIIPAGIKNLFPVPGATSLQPNL